MKSRKSLAGGLLFASLFCASASYADPVRLPASGNPAFAFDAPADWMINYDHDGNLQLFCADRFCVLQLSWVTAANSSTADVASNLLKHTGAQPYSRHSPGTLAGSPADTFDSAFIAKDTGKLQLSVRLWVMKVDETRYAIQATLTVPEISADDSAALDALIADVRITGLK